MAISPFDLELFGVYDAGIANRERIVLRVHRTVDLTQYGVMVGFKSGETRIYPARDLFLWLGNTTIQGPAWVFIFTGEGQPTVSQETHTNEPIHAIYWNRPNVFFSNPNVIPALVNFGEVQVWTGNKSMTELLQQKEQAALTQLTANLFKK
jgi:hypothetical protein